MQAPPLRQMSTFHKTVGGGAIRRPEKRITANYRREEQAPPLPYIKHSAKSVGGMPFEDGLAPLGTPKRLRFTANITATFFTPENYFSRYDIICRIIHNLKI